MPTRNVSLTDHFDSFIASGIEAGRYSDASEVICEGLRLLEQREAENRARIAWLQGAVQEGIDQIERGEGMLFSSSGDLAAHIRSIGEEVSSELVSGNARD